VKDVKTRKVKTVLLNKHGGKKRETQQNIADGDLMPHDAKGLVIRLSYLPSFDTSRPDLDC